MNNESLKVLFIGNSITFHPPLPELGWHGNWGMAASCMETDYVHVLMNRIKQKNPNSLCLYLNAADFERNFQDYELGKLKDARDFEADIIIMRIIENVDKNDIKPLNFDRHYAELIHYLDKTGKACILCTGSFWEDEESDKVIEQVCRKKGYEFVDLSSTWADVSNQARDSFEDRFVGMHPSDRGMKRIAQLIWEKLRLNLRIPKERKEILIGVII